MEYFIVYKLWNTLYNTVLYKYAWFIQIVYIEIYIWTSLVAESPNAF